MMPIKKIFLVIFIGGLSMFPEKGMAKRVAPLKISPVTYEGVEYTAVYEGVGSSVASCSVTAKKAKTSEPLWKIVIYRVPYNKTKETDVQDVWPSSILIRAGDIVVKNEDNDEFDLDRNSGRLKASSRAVDSQLEYPLSSQDENTAITIATKAAEKVARYESWKKQGLQWFVRARPVGPLWQVVFDIPKGPTDQGFQISVDVNKKAVTSVLEFRA